MPKKKIQSLSSLLGFYSRQPLPHIRLLIQPPSQTTRIMHRRPTHIAPKPALEAAPSRAVHDTGIIPEDQIALILPLDGEDVLGLGGVGVELVKELLGLFGLQALDMVHMRRDVQVHPSRGLVPLDESVPTHWVRRWVDVVEEVRRGGLAGVPQRVRCDVVLVQQLLF